MKIDGGAEGVVVQGDAEQYAEWTRAAGDVPLGAWLSALADAEAAKSAERAWPVVVQLRHPVDHGERHISTLEFRRGQAKDIKGMQLRTEVSTDQLLLIASRLCGQPVPVIEKLDVEDAAEAMAIAMDFFGRCLGGGKRR